MKLGTDIIQICAGYSKFKYAHPAETMGKLRRHRSSGRQSVSVSELTSAARYIIKNKTHHYIIFFVRPRHSEPGMDRYC